MNQYIENMKNALMNYNSEKQKSVQRQNEIRELYGEEAAKKEYARLENHLKSARNTAEAAIREAYSEGVYLAEQWGKMDGSKLTDDVKLLDADLVDTDTFEKLKSRHQGNATMLMALKKYGERQNEAAQKKAQEKGDFMSAMNNPYNVKDITTLPDKLNNWQKAKKQAFDTLDMIDGKGQFSDPWAQALGKALGEQTIEHFGEGESY